MTTLYIAVGVLFVVMILAGVFDHVRKKSQKSNKIEPVINTPKSVINTPRVVVDNSPGSHSDYALQKTQTHRELANARIADAFKMAKDKMTTEEYQQKWGHTRIQ